MNQPNPERKSQEQDNSLEGNNINRDLIFAPQQTINIETQTVEIGAEKVTEQSLIKASPYKGLKRFNFGDREYFFGRDALIVKLFEAVNKSSFSLVLGASGSGKSSAVRAGLIPELKKFIESNKFYNFVFTPDEDPFDSLSVCLRNREKDYSFSKSEADIALGAKADTLSEVIKTLKKENEKWLIFVDQFEELFTICTDREKRKNFIEGIVRIAKKEDSFKIVLAMRADFLEQFSFYPTLGAIANENNMHLVTDMLSDELREAIEQPAAKHGVVFEKGLVEQIIKDVEGQKGYLPLLQYTLDLLWEKACITISSDGRPHIEDRILEHTNYKALGKVRGALQKRVNEIYEDICQKNNDGESVTKKIFLNLVKIVESDSESRAVSQRAYRYKFDGESTKSTLQKFIDENLLVSNYENLSEEKLLIGNSTNSTKRATIEIAHESLLSSWDKLKLWLEEEKETIILKNWLAGETKRWLKVVKKDESKANDELLKGSRLEQIVALREKDAFKKLGGLDKEENQFIDASVDWRDRQEKEKQEQRKRLLEALKEAELNLADSLSYSSLYQFGQRNELDALVEAIKAGKILQKHQKTTPKVINALQEILNEGSERNRLIGHKGRVKSVAFSSDINNQILASASEDGTVQLWNLEGKKLQAPLEHNSKVRTVAFSHDDRILASAGEDGTIKLWMRNSTDKFNTVPDQIFEGHTGQVNSVAFSPEDDRILASAGDDGTVKLWMRNSTGQFNNQPDQIFRRPDENFNSIVFSPDSQMLASASQHRNYMDGAVYLWRRNSTGQFDTEPDQILKGDTGSILCVAFSPDSKTIATGNESQTVNLWKQNSTGQFETQPDKILRGHAGWVNSVAFSPDGPTLASASGDRTVKLWNLEEKENAPQAFVGHTQWVWNVAFSPDGQIIASASGDTTVKLWDTQGNLLQTLVGHQSIVRTVAFSPNGQILASAGDDRTIRLWKRNSTGQFETQPDQIFEGHGASSVAFNPNGDILVSASVDTTIKLWKRNSTGKFNTQPDQILMGHEGGANRAIFSLDGKTIASIGNDKTIKLWKQNNTGKFNTQPDQILKSDDVEILGVAFSPNDEILATSGTDQIIKLWRRNSEGKFNTTKPNILKGHKDIVASVAFSPDGQILASESGIAVKLWNLEGEELLTLYNPFREKNDWLRSVVFSPDGKTIVAGGGLDIQIILWRNIDELKLDTLMESACNWVGDYLQYSKDIEEESDRHLCDSIGN